jgi:hypothetical protein
MKTYKVEYHFNVLDKGIRLEKRYCFISSDSEDELTLRKIANDRIIEIEEAPKTKFKLVIFSEIN